MAEVRDGGAGGEPLPLAVLVVDDERPARRKLRRMLDAAPGVDRVLEASTGRVALEILREHAPDVLFLDVRMPGMDGFQLLDALDGRADVQVVFVTAYDEHAVRAFEVRAADYLLKPFDEPRFREALERAREGVAARRASLDRRTLGELLAALRRGPAAEPAGRLLVEASSGRRVLLPLERVVRIEAARNDAVFHTDGRTYRLRTTLAELAVRLDPDRFLRINRSEIVNLEHVAEIEPLDHGDARIHMQGGDVRRLSRRYRQGIARFG